MAITENLIISSCVGKVVFETFAHAQLGVRRHEVEPYHCKVCGKWHVGGKELRRGRKLQRKKFNQKKDRKS